MESFGANFAGAKGQWGGIAKDNRLFINAVLWILRTEAPWRDTGVWGRILSVLAKYPDFEWLMIDASHCKVHPHAAGAIGGNEGRNRTKEGHEKFIWPWMRLVCRSEPLLLMPQELTAKKLFR